MNSRLVITRFLIHTFQIIALIMTYSNLSYAEVEENESDEPNRRAVYEYHKRKAEEQFLKTYKGLVLGGENTLEGKLVTATFFKRLSEVQLEIDNSLTPSSRPCEPANKTPPIPSDILSMEYLHYVQSFPPGEFDKKQVELNPDEKRFYASIRSKLQISEYGKEMLETAKKLNFQFAGFTRTHSKANTDPNSRLIRIREDLDDNTAALSLAYELSNLINSSRYRAIFADAQLCNFDADSYAKELIRLESEAVLRRSVVAKEIQQENLIENQTYHRIATNSKLGTSEKIEMLRNEISTNGRVGKNKIPVTDYYKNQFRDFYNHCKR